MKKILVCLFIGFFVLTVESLASCACCGGSTEIQAYTVGGMPVRREVCSGSCSSCASYSMCGTCGKCSTHCSCPKWPSSSSSSSSGGSSSGSSSSSSGSTSHSCSFVSICSKAHCSKYVCSCGEHKNNATCGGGHNSSGYCYHCSEPYCSNCGHGCTHNSLGYCSKPHCTYRTYCTNCGHSCDGDHRYGSSICSQVHCTDLVCTVSGCTQHRTGVCGGGHTYGAWKEENGVHNRYCGRTNLGCTAIVSTHPIIWGQPNSKHISTCKKGCGLKNTHAPVWGNFYKNGESHSRNCTVIVGSEMCTAVDSHTPEWTEFLKADDGGEESGAEHLRRCTVTACDLTTDRHGWASNVKWIAISEEEHRRTCPTCSLIQTLPHDFFNREAIKDDFENHYKVCIDCVDNSGNQYKLHEKHVDGEAGGRGNGICDLCDKEIWRIKLSNEGLTNEDITVKVDIYSVYDNGIMELPVKVIDDDGNEMIGDDGVYTITENGTYIFYFETPDAKVEVTINNISKSIHGRIAVSPTMATTNDVLLSFIVGDDAVMAVNGDRKDIWLKYDDEAYTSMAGEMKDNGEIVYKIEKKVSNNGKYVFWAKDSLENERQFEVDINNIVSGFGSVTTTYDAFKGGYIFTDILINVNKEYDFVENVIKSLEGNIKCYKINNTGNSTLRDVNINKVQIKDELGNIVNGNKLSSGAYYLRIAIGGKYSTHENVFDEGMYMVEIKDVTVNSVDGDVILKGKNRIEVIVQDLNDLT